MAHTCLNYYIAPLLDIPEDFKRHVEEIIKDCTKSFQVIVAQEKEFLCFVNLIETGVIMKDACFLRKVSNFIMKAARVNTLKNVVERLTLNFGRNRNLQPLVDIIKFRVKMLEDELGEGSKFSWKMPNANIVIEIFVLNFV
jgi:hypothetical protein